MNNTIQPVCGNFLFLRGPYVQRRQQVDLWEHTSNLCADITEKSNSAGSRGLFQRSQNAKLYLRTKATWVKAAQATNLKSCHCICSFVSSRFLPIPLFSLWLLPLPNTLSIQQTTEPFFSSSTETCSWKKRFIKNSIKKTHKICTRIMQMDRFGK